MSKLDRKSVVGWWDGASDNERKEFLQEVGVYAYFFSPLRKCCFDSLEKLLIDLTTIFNRNNLHYWLDFGALLGLVRAGELIPYDKDIDIGIFESDIDKYNSLQKQIEDKGYQFHKVDRQLLQSTDNFVPRVHLGLDKPHCRDYCACDIFVWQNLMKHPPRKSVVLNHGGMVQCDSSYFEETEWLEWKGHKMRVPKKREEYLSMRYGPKWRLADPLYYRHNYIGSA